MIYQWKPGFPTRKVDPAAAARQLQAIRRYHKSLTPDLIVEDSKRSDAPLNPIFEWNNTEAAYQYRLSQARNVCRSLVFVREDVPDQPPIRAFVHLSGGEDTGSRYESLQVVMQDQAMRHRAITMAWRELQAWRARYEEYKEFARVIDVIEEVAPEVAAAA